MSHARGPRAEAAGAAPGHARRPVGTLALLALGLNGIIGVGIFYAPSEIAALAPGRTSLFVIAATAAALGPVAYAVGLLGSRFPEDGGPVLYAREAFGERAAFAVGWLAYASAVFSTAATLSGTARALAARAPGLGTAAERVLGVLLATALAAIAALGIRVSARVWSALTLAKLAPLAALAIVAVAAGAPRAALAAPTAAPAPEALLRAALTATFAFQGFEIVPIIAGQVRGAERAVPRAVTLALAVAAALYVVLQAACVAGVPGLAASPSPLEAAAGAFGGAMLADAVRAGVDVSALGITFGMITMTPRYLSALAAVSGLGFGLARATAGGAPLRALGVTWALAAALVAAGDLGELFSLASVAVVMQYALAGCALAALARRGARGLAPRHAWAAAPVLVVAAALLAGARAREWTCAAATLGAGLALRVASRRAGGRGARLP